MILQVHALVASLAAITMVVSFTITFRSIGQRKPQVARVATRVAAISILVGAAACLSAFAVGYHLYVI